MLDVRIYRTGLVAAALALVVLAFSLTNQQGARTPSLAPEAFSGTNVYNEMTTLAREQPSRAPGSHGDGVLADIVADKLSDDGFDTSTQSFTGQTVDGPRTLQNVIASRPGMESGSIVIVASRDSVGSPGPASTPAEQAAWQARGLSGTATLIELARDLSGETLNRTVVLASTSGTEGTAGAVKLASTLPGPIDAVIVLGDLASARVEQPIVIPWSGRDTVAPPVLRNTLAATISQQTTLRTGFTSIGGQFAHLALPLTISQQGPFGARGIPAVELSVSGENGPGTHGDPIAGTPQLAGLGRAVLSTISALDTGTSVGTPSSYLLLAGKVVPGWAIALFVLTLLVPIALTTIDALARARRRGHQIVRSLALVLASAVPFALACAVVLAARWLGAIHAAPPGPLGPGAVALDGAGVAVLAVAALVAIVSAIGLQMAARAWIAPPAARASTSRGDSRHRDVQRPGDGVAVALLIVLWLVTLAIWAQNPFAAALLIPALHLWLWAVDPDRRIPLVARLVMIAAGFMPIALVLAYFARTMGFSAPELLWTGALLIAGHGIGLLTLLECSIVLGCAVSAAALVTAAARRPAPRAAPVTVRGPINYAGPGSLGGTESAIRR